MSRVARRSYLTGSAALLGGILAAACDRSEARRRPPDVAGSSTPTPHLQPGRPIVPAPAKGTVTLPILVQLEWISAHRDILRDLAIRFTDQHPHLRIKWQQRPWRTVANGLERERGVRMAAAGQLGAVIADHTAIIAVLVAARALLGLNRLIARDRYPLADYWPAAVQALQWQGDHFGLQTAVVPTVLYYNPVLVTAAGVTVPTQPWTWTQFLAAAQQLTARPVFGFALSEHRAADILPWLWSYGGRMVNADFRASMIAQPEALDALQWLLDLTFVHRVSPQAADLQRAGTQSSLALLMQRRQLGMLYGTWHSKSLLAKWYGQAPYAVAEPPTGPQQAATSLGEGQSFSLQSFSIVKDSGNDDGAWTFLSWWTSRDTQQVFHASRSGEAYAGVPARRSLVDEQPTRYAAGTVAALASARAAPLHPTWRELVRALDAGLAPLWDGQQDVAAAMAAVAQRQNAILDRWWQQQRGSP